MHWLRGRGGEEDGGGGGGRRGEWGEGGGEKRRRREEENVFIHLSTYKISGRYDHMTQIFVNTLQPHTTLCTGQEHEHVPAPHKTWFSHVPQ